jgi:CMP-N,N'-diacetyllegionaminic acid synthase
MIIAYVPARGGSKEILRKNLIRVGGESLVERTIRASLESKLIDTTWVSTEDSEILELAARSGAESSYRRPGHLAEDESSIVDGLIHFLDWLTAERLIKPEAVVVLQPTSPFRDGALLDEALRRFIKLGVPSMFSVSRVRQHPREMIKWSHGSQEWSQLSGWPHTRGQRQSYESDLFFINGSIFVVEPDFVREHKTFVSQGLSEPFEIPEEYAFEIDSSLDLMLARHISRGTK